MRLGARVQAAVACGINSKCLWRSYKTPGITQALADEHLKTAGLVSLRDGWIRSALRGAGCRVLWELRGSNPQATRRLTIFNFRNLFSPQHLVL